MHGDSDLVQYMVTYSAVHGDLVHGDSDLMHGDSDLVQYMVTYSAVHGDLVHGDSDLMHGDSDLVQYMHDSTKSVLIGQNRFGIIILRTWKWENRRLFS